MEAVKIWNNEEKRQEVCRYIKETAERFVREAEENERNPQRKALRMSFADVEKILVRSTANLKAHGGKSPFAK